MFRGYNDVPAQHKLCPLTSIFMLVTYVRLASFPALSAAEGSVGIVQLRALAVDGQRKRPKRWKQILGIKRPGSGHEHPANYDPFRWPLALETDPFRFTSQPSGAPSANPTASPTKRPTPEPTSAPTSSTSSPTTYRWIPDEWQGRETNGLPDFSYSGYQFGDREPPSVGRKDSELRWERSVVRDYGATPDDEKDDTNAFRAALADGGRIFVPRGRYIISDQLIINKSGTVLGGPDGENPPELYFPRSLSLTNPVKMSSTAGGKATSPYSWGGGLIEFQGGSKTVGSARIIVQDANPLGTLGLESVPSELEVGSTVIIILRGDGSLVKAAYGGDPGDFSRLELPVRITMVRRILSVDHTKKTVVMSGGALPIGLRQEWLPTLQVMENKFQEAGLQNLQITFPRTNYRGHHTEVGFNAIVVSGTNNWVRNVAIHNADSGIFCYGYGNTMLNITLTSSRRSEAYNGAVGHHGITLGGRNNVLNGFNIDARFFHDITVSNFVNGNVASNGRATDLAIDHHKRGPFNNLFTNIDAGRGSRLFYSGGGRGWGKYAGTANVYWSIQADRYLFPPSTEEFGATGSWFVAIESEVRRTPNNMRSWSSRSDFSDPMHPANLYKAQRMERGIHIHAP